MLDETHDGNSLPYFSSEHEILRAQIRRFVETEIKPYAQAWEDQGFVPREVLRRMGELGFFGIRYPQQYGGSEMDVLASVVLAEELGRSTFGGVAITVLVHTDMASVHIYNSGVQAIRDRFMPDIISGRKIVAVAVTEPVLYQHFKTKRDLYGAIIEAKARQASERVHSLRPFAESGDDRAFFTRLAEQILRR